MSDLDKELNFDDVVGGKLLHPTTQRVEANKKDIGKAKSVKKAGIVLSISATEPLLYKDIIECTALEFVNWASRVYPVSLEEHVNRFKIPQNRLRMFQKILYYHINTPFWMGTNKKPNPVDTLN